MRFGKCCVPQVHQLRLAFDTYRDEVLSIAIASWSFFMLATSRIAVGDVNIPSAALAAGAALSLLVHFLSPNVRLRRAVRAGLRRGEFHVVYQPIIDTRTQRCVGVEALLRWRNAKFAEGGPGAFIGKLEGTHWSGALTRFVLSEATRALGPATFARHWHLSVNICARHLMEEGFAEDIRESAGPMLGRLVLEVTERSCVEPTPRVLRTLGRLKELHVRLSLDDFGTGFSNLDLLANFRFDLVKIDRQFLKLRGEARATFLETVAALVHTLGAKVVAEGVESAADHQVVQRSGIDLAQGYWYGEPMTIGELGLFASASTPGVDGRRGTGTGHPT